MNLRQKAQELNVKATKPVTLKLPYDDYTPASTARSWLSLLQDFLNQYPDQQGELSQESGWEGELEAIIVIVQVPKTDDELLLDIQKAEQAQKEQLDREYREYERLKALFQDGA